MTCTHCSRNWWDCRCVNGDARRLDSPGLLRRHLPYLAAVASLMAIAYVAFGPWAALYVGGAVGVTGVMR